MYLLKFNLVAMLITCLYFTDFAYSADGQCPDENIRVQLNWINDPTFTGEYVALDKFWLKKKLNVAVNQGGLGIDPIAMIVAKKADYAVVGADKALIAISNKAPISIISIDLQRNPVGWIARPELKVTQFKDLRNRSDLILGDKAGTEVSSILRVILKRLKLNDLEPQAVSFDFSYFLARENAIYPVYLNEEPFRARILHKLNTIEIDPGSEENGAVRLYGNVIITHESTANLCSDLNHAFISGLNEGWGYAITNPKEATSIVNKYVKENEDYISESVKRTLFYATDYYGIKVPQGHMDIGSWRDTINVLKDADLILDNINYYDSIKF